eukprot:1987364-Pyramimonas_sp.AAC.1
MASQMAPRMAPKGHIPNQTPRDLQGCFKRQSQRPPEVSWFNISGRLPSPGFARPSFLDGLLGIL